MKKFFLLSLAAIGLAGLATATPVTCSVLMTPNNGGSPQTGSSCTVTPDAGDFINSLTLTVTDDFTGYQSGTPIVSYAASLMQSTPVFTGLTFCNVTNSGNNSVPCSVSVAPSATVGGLDITTPYSLNLASAVNTVSGGAVTGASIVLNLNFTESPIGTTTPEPATLGLTGMALLGVGFLARRKGKARV